MHANLCMRALRWGEPRRRAPWGEWCWPFFLPSIHPPSQQTTALTYTNAHMHARMRMHEGKSRRKAHCAAQSDAGLALASAELNIFMHTLRSYGEAPRAEKNRARRSRMPLSRVLLRSARRRPLGRRRASRRATRPPPSAPVEGVQCVVWG